MTVHFSIAELERSDIARRQGWDNRVPPELLDNARRTLEMLERIRTLIGHAMFLLSGYRCLLLNRAVGSNDDSAHVLASAGDWISPSFGTPTEICRLLAQHIDALHIGQIINEYPGGDGQGWVHTGLQIPDREINRIITIDRRADGVIATLPGIMDSFS